MVWNEAAEALMRKGLPPPVAGDLTLEECEMYGIPLYARIEIGLRRRHSWPVVAEILRGLAASLDVMGRRTDLPERTLCLMVRSEIWAANQKIKSTTKSGSRDQGQP